MPNTRSKTTLREFAQPSTIVNQVDDNAAVLPDASTTDGGENFMNQMMLAQQMMMSNIFQ
jgi:hypothetical protein